MSTIILNILIIFSALAIWFANHAIEERALKKLEAEIEEEAKKK